MPEITNRQIAKVARGLSVSRDVFARAYDDVASWQSPPSADFMTISGLADQEHPQNVGNDRDAFHYTRAMQRARDENWLADVRKPLYATAAIPDIAAQFQRSVDNAEPIAPKHAFLRLNRRNADVKMGQPMQRPWPSTNPRSCRLSDPAFPAEPSAHNRGSRRLTTIEERLIHLRVTQRTMVTSLGV